MVRKKLKNKKNFFEKVINLDRSFFSFKTLFKLIFIFIFIFLFLFSNSFYENENEINLLAVSQNNLEEDNLYKLKLKVRKGNGKIYLDTNKIFEEDTQISILDSNRYACEVFDLKCDKFDFYYSFEGDSLILKGPSASSSIAILTASNINKHNLKKDVIITGGLSQGGLITNVGSIEKKIVLAINNNFSKVLVPKFSLSNKNEINYSKYDINVLLVLDIFDAYNYFLEDKNSFKKEHFKIENSNKPLQILSNEVYKNSMKKMSENLCYNTQKKLEKFNKFKLDNFNLSKRILSLENRTKKLINFSKKHKEEKNYYTYGSYCYRININLDYLNFYLENFYKDDKKKLIKKIEGEFNEIKIEVDDLENYLIKKSPEDFIRTQNDFYRYLILSSRINEAKSGISNLEKQNISNFTKEQILDFYFGISSIKNRIDTINQWKSFLKNTGKRIEISENLLKDYCYKIRKEVFLKNVILQSYNVDIFNQNLNEFDKISNTKRYELCIYNGLELISNINLINIGSDESNLEEHQKEIRKLLEDRFSRLDKNDFPVIPLMYHEYSNSLLEDGDDFSSLKFLIQALVFLDINYDLKETHEYDIFRDSFYNLLKNKVFFILLFLLFSLILIV